MHQIDKLMTRRVGRMGAAVIAALVLLTASGAFGAEVEKLFELKDGTTVVGFVVDEGSTAYLVRTRTGETIRVLYEDIERVDPLQQREDDRNSRDREREWSDERERGDLEEEVARPEGEMRLRRARSRRRLSGGLAGASAGTFGASLALVGAGAVIGGVTDDELPAIPIALAGGAVMGVSIGLLAGSTRFGRLALRTSTVARKPPPTLAIVGASLWSVGLIGGIVSPITLSDRARVVATAICAGVGVTGYALWQIDGAILRHALVLEEDRRELAIRPRIPFRVRGIGVAPLGSGVAIALGGDF